jgi:hypothetical protein
MSIKFNVTADIPALVKAAPAGPVIAAVDEFCTVCIFALLLPAANTDVMTA